MARLRGADFAAETVSLDAKGSVGSAAPKFDGRISFARASGSADLRRSLVESARGLAGTPVGPLAAKAVAALGRVLADASGSAGFAIAGEGPTARVDLIAPELTSASGAHFTGSADSRIGYLYGADEPAVIATGRWGIAGGDLPSGTLSIDRSTEGRVTGLASLDPYAAEGARLALTPVRFSGGAGGLLRFRYSRDALGSARGRARRTADSAGERLSGSDRRARVRRRMQPRRGRPDRDQRIPARSQRNRPVQPARARLC